MSTTDNTIQYHGGLQTRKFGLRKFGQFIQSHYIEVAQGDIFMKQKMRFELVLGWMAKLKKNWGPIMSNLRVFFHVFRDKK